VVSVEELEPALRAELPLELRQYADELAALLYDVARGAFPPEVARKRLAHPISLVLLAELVDCPLPDLAVRQNPGGSLILDLGSGDQHLRYLLPAPPAQGSPLPTPEVEHVHGDTVDGDKVAGDKITADVIGGDVVGGDKITVTTIVSNWFDSALKALSTGLHRLGAFCVRHGPLLGALLVLEAALFAGFLHYRRLYLIPAWRFWLAALLLGTTGLAWYALLRRRSRMRLALAPAITIASLALLGWQAQQIVTPQQFDPRLFGIVVAELGDGADFARTSRSRELTSQIYERLCATLSDEFREDACAPGANAETRRIALARVGIIGDSGTAESLGQAMQADVVIWGQILSSPNGTATVRFEVLETADRAATPEFPAVLPVADASTELIVGEIDEDNPAVLKDIVSRQSAGITAFTLGLIDFFDQKYASASRHFERTLSSMETLPLSPERMSLIYFYLGRCYNAMGRIPEGQEWLKKAAAANPREPAVTLSMALASASIGDEQAHATYLTQALNTLNMIVLVEPANTAARYNRGIIYQVRDQFEDAQREYQEVLRLDPSHYVSYINLAQVQARLRRFDDSAATLRQAITLAEQHGANSVWAYLNLALVLQEDGKLDEARAAFEQALALGPDSVWTYYYFARFLEEQAGETDAAIRLYEQMLGVARWQGWNLSWAYAKTGDFYKRQGIPEQAADYYTRALTEDPDDALLRAYLAEMRVELGQTEQALAEYKQALADNASIPYIFLSYGGALFRLGEYGEAAQRYEQALALDPANVAALYNLGLCERQLGRVEQAVQRFQAIIDGADRYPTAMVERARAQLATLQP
jgi:tetratricopeptide (TPR) repeat protein